MMTYRDKQDYARYLRSRGYSSPFHEDLIYSESVPYLHDPHGSLVVRAHSGMMRPVTPEERSLYAHLRKEEIRRRGHLRRSMPAYPRDVMDIAVERAMVDRILSRRARRHSKVRRSR